MDEQGQVLWMLKIEVERWWTSLTIEPEQVIERYRDHGRSAQFHSEIKTELDWERLPPGKWATNRLVLMLGLLGVQLAADVRSGEFEGRRGAFEGESEASADPDGDPKLDLPGGASGAACAAVGGVFRAEAAVGAGPCAAA